MTAKPTKPGEYREVNYNNAHWATLKQMRRKATELMNALENAHLRVVVHGSVARGDVKSSSDVDVFIACVQSGFSVEAALEKAGYQINNRLVVQATPTYAVKAHIEIDEQTSVTFPLSEMRKVEQEFYRFGGEVNLAQLEQDLRVVGVDKRLLLIEPTETGHVESSIIGCEVSTAKLLGISVDTILDRVHALLRRDAVGRTGVFLKRELQPDETFELALKRIAESNPAVRRKMKK